MPKVYKFVPRKPIMTPEGAKMVNRPVYQVRAETLDCVVKRSDTFWWLWSANSVQWKRINEPVASLTRGY